ncbi:hypothetical protein ABFT51_02430 [Paenibacillus peoriae]|uniref:hypothetical protein n=1 Tax=Paenibacillus peoriae TaxID=59893 RepID=UPI0032AFD2EE
MKHLNNYSYFPICTQKNTAQLLDKSAIKSLNTDSSEQSSEYKQLRNELNTLRLQTGILYIYMYNRVGDEWKITVDGAAWDDKDYSHSELL